MNADNIITEFAGLLGSGQLRFRKTENEGVTYYYAENELYLVVDDRASPRMFALVHARSPESVTAAVASRGLFWQSDAAKEEVDRLRDQKRAADEEILHLRDRIHELEGARDAKDACDYARGAMLKKPPLGLVPRSVRDFERVSEILEALGRYNDAGKPVPREWLAELEEKIRKEETSGVDGVFFAPDMQPKTQLVQEVTR